MEKTMRQVVIQEPRKILVEHVSIPKVLPQTVLVRVKYCGICGTDLMNYRGQIVWGRSKYPKYPGHEMSGVIEELGEGVKHLKVGDFITAECTIGCGVCSYCKKGNYSLCRDRLNFSNGSMADYVVVPAKAVYKLPENCDLLEGALIEPVAVGCNAALKCGVVFGKRTGVIGCGTIGLGSLITFRILGAAEIIGFDIREDRLELAQKVGATSVVNVKDSNAMSKVEQEGLDALVVASAGTAETLSFAVRMISSMGVISVVGLSGGILSPIDGDMLSEKEAILIGSHSSPGVWDALLALKRVGKLDLIPLVSHVFSLDDAPAAFALLDDPGARAQKVVLEI